MALKNIDVKKIIGKKDKDQYELSTHSVFLSGKLVEALSIMQSIINNPDEMDFHNNKIKEFYKQFI